MFYGRFFKVCRSIVRFFCSEYKTVWQEPPPTPAVYLCRHLGQQGPIVAVGWLPRQMHFWAYSPLCEQEAGRRHFAEYTFRQRMHMPGWLADRLARPVGDFMATMCQSAQAVPVYRDKNSFKTMSLSIKLLQQGEDIIIFPDIDYTNKDGGQELYDGFIYLERFYHHATGQHLSFMPLRIDDVEHIISAGPAIRFSDGDFFSQKEAVLQQIAEAISGEAAGGA